MTHHVIIPCDKELHERAQAFLQEVENGNAASQGETLATIAKDFYDLIISDYTGAQFQLANVNKTISQTAIKLFSATAKQMINFFIPKLKEKDIINLGDYVKSRMLVIDGETYIGWPAPNNAYEILTGLLEKTQANNVTEQEIETARAVYLDYQIEASKHINDVLFQPGDIITLGPINKRLVTAGKKATRNGAITAIKRAVNAGSAEHLDVILNFQLSNLAEI